MFYQRGCKMNQRLHRDTLSIFLIIIEQNVSSLRYNEYCSLCRSWTWVRRNKMGNGVWTRLQTRQMDVILGLTHESVPNRWHSTWTVWHERTSILYGIVSLGQSRRVRQKGRESVDGNGSVYLSKWRFSKFTDVIRKQRNSFTHSN